MFTLFVVRGSLIERGTEPRAAWCDIRSIPSQALRQTSLVGECRPVQIQTFDSVQRLHYFFKAPCSQIIEHSLL
jgi:hypothetical protein